jgi:hypothetical protein
LGRRATGLNRQEKIMELISTPQPHQTTGERISRRLERQRLVQAKMARRGETRRGTRAMRVRSAIAESLAR